MAGINLLVNGALEAGVARNTSTMSATKPMPGWTASKYAEIWGSGANGKTSRDGGNFVEIDAGTGSLSQSVKTTLGKTYELAFDLAGRPGYISSSKVDVFWNNVKVGVITPTNSDWKSYKFNVVGTGGNDKLTFQAVSGDNDTVGGLLDNISLTDSTPVTPPNSGDIGSWNPAQDWPLIAIHSVVTQDGKVLTFGTDLNGMQSGVMYHDLYDPMTGEHMTLNHATHTPTDVFCSAAIIIPGTDKILISGGDARPLGNYNGPVNDSNVFDLSTHQISSSVEGEMAVPRWYNTMVSLGSGQILNFGGSGSGGIVEIFTEGEGWRKLGGATDGQVSASWYYPRAWVASSGEVIYFATGAGTNSAFEVMALDPAGEGTIRQIGTLPFATTGNSPAIMYDVGKVLIMAQNGQLWTMDISGATPVFKNVGIADQDRDDANMTVLADGKVLINGGSSSGNTMDGVIRTASIWDPDTGTFTKTPAEDFARLYHSTSVLLVDGTVLSAGGGAPGPQTNLNAQVYKPPYLFDDNGNLATRPVISGAPESVEPGETFTLTADNAASITKLTFIKTGAATHAFNMDARTVDLTFTKGPGNTLVVTVPENANDVTAGSWMLFAWNDKGVPSIAPIIAVEPTVPDFDGVGDLRTEYFTIGATTSALSQVDFSGTPIHVERNSMVLEVNEGGTAGHYTGGPAYDFAVKHTGEFDAGSAGAYIFYLTSDDAAALFIDGVQVATRPSGNSTGTATATVNLTNGKHSIELRYLNNSGATTLDLDWAGPGFGRIQMNFDGAEQNLLANGALEHWAADAATNQLARINGWTGGNNIEMWSNGSNGIPATSGRSAVEVDGVTGSLSQSVATVAGETYKLSFDLAGRPNFIASSKLDVLVNGVIIKTITPANTRWERYDVSFVGTGNDKVEFKAIAGDTDAYGALIDSIVLTGKMPDGDVTTPTDPTNLLVNGSFENVPGAHAGMPMEIVATNGQVGSWQSSNNRIEVWTEGKNSVTGTDGKNVVEVNAQNGTLSQSVATEAGKFYGISFDYAGQPGAIASSKMEVLWNGAVIGTVEPTDAMMKNYHFHAHGTGGNDVLAFRAVAGDTDSLGGLLDQVKFYVSGHEPATQIKDDTAEIAKNGMVLIDISANDGGTGSSTLDGQPANGTVQVITDGKWLYTPRADFVGADTFTYSRLNQQTGQMEKATVTVTVGATSANHAPAAVADSAVTYAFDGATGNVLTNDTDADGDTLTVYNLPNSQVTFQADGSYTLPAASPSGNASYLVVDDNGAATVGNLAVTSGFYPNATPQNDAATVVSGSSIVINVLANDTGGGPRGLVLPAGAATAPANGAVVQNADNTFTYTPKAGFTGTDTFEYFVNSAGTAEPQKAMVTVTVTAPVVPTVDVELAKNTLVLIDSPIPETQPTNGTLVNIADGKWLYTPRADFTGSDSFTYKKMNTTTGQMETVTTKIEVKATISNHTPTAVADSAVTYAFGGATGNVLTNDTDADGDTLTVYNLPNSQVTFQADGSYTLAAGSAAGSVSYLLVDDNGAATVGTLAVTSGLYATPTPANDAATVTGGQSVTINVLANDTGGGPKGLKLAGVTAGPNGTVVANLDGTITYTPKAGFVGSDTFQYQVTSDGSDPTPKTASVVVTVNGTTPSVNVINGTAGNDYLIDTDADDVMLGGAGMDTFRLTGKGNDTVDGGEGGYFYNQVDLAGKASDYTFTRNTDGTYTVSSAAYGTDTLKNIQGLWFMGERKWYDPLTLAKVPAGTTFIIDGTSGNDLIFDSEGNDIINAGAGRDVITLNKSGDDFVDGGADFNQVNLSGKASDFTFARNPDGTITVSSAAYGVDTLKNINGFWFRDEGRWYDSSQLAPASSAAKAAAVSMSSLGAANDSKAVAQIDLGVADLDFSHDAMAPAAEDASALHHFDDAADWRPLDTMVA